MRKTTQPPSRLPPAWAGLWDEARHWVRLLPQVFGEPAELRAAGLSRRVALRCRNWLWSIEGLVRRLLIAAAFAFDLGKLAPLRQRRRAAESRAVNPPSRPPRFRLFVCVGGAASGVARHIPKAATPYAHVPFPADDLLRLGAPREVRRRAVPQSGPENAAPVAPRDAGGQPRRMNPLHRRGRIPRWDPDYRSVEDKALAGSLRGISTRSPPTGEHKRPAPVSSLHRLPDPVEWRRVEDEWQRVLPAPDLAVRIAALLRVVDEPSRWIARLARRLKRSNLSARLAALPFPALRRPKLDATPPPPLRDKMADAHGLMQLDTS